MPVQKGSRSKSRLSRAAHLSRQVSREVAGALDDVINAIDKAEMPAESEAVDQAAVGRGPASEERAVSW